MDQPLSRSVVTPISCTKLKIHSAHVDSPSSGLNTFLCSVIYKWKLYEKERNNLKAGPVSASQIKKLKKRFCWVDQPLSRSVLTPISCTKLKIHSAHADSPCSCTQFYELRFTSENSIKKRNNLEVGPVFDLQIKKLRKRFCWVDQPLSRSVLTHVSCKKLKIYSAHADSPVS